MMLNKIFDLVYFTFFLYLFVCVVSEISVIRPTTESGGLVGDDSCSSLSSFRREDNIHRDDTVLSLNYLYGVQSYCLLVIYRQERDILEL